MARPTTIYIFDKNQQKGNYAALRRMRHASHSRSIKIANSQEGLESLFESGKPDLLFVDIFAGREYQQEAVMAYKWARDQIKKPEDRFEAWHIGRRGIGLQNLPSGLYLERNNELLGKMEELITRWEDNPQLR